MDFEGGQMPTRSKKSHIDSESDKQQKRPSQNKSKFRKRNLEGGEGSGESNKKSLLLDQRFTKGEILRENTKKTGLKTYAEDRKHTKKDSNIRNQAMK